MRVILSERAKHFTREPEFNVFLVDQIRAISCGTAQPVLCGGPVGWFRAEYAAEWFNFIHETDKGLLTIFCRREHCETLYRVNIAELERDFSIPSLSPD